jgi:hypothetical protein
MTVSHNMFTIINETIRKLNKYQKINSEIRKIGGKEQSVYFCKAEDLRIKQQNSAHR